MIGVSGEAQRESLVMLTRREGIVLESVYSGKAFHALRSELGRRLAGMKNVLFIHTGGVFGLAAYADVLPALQLATKP